MKGIWKKALAALLCVVVLGGCSKTAASPSTLPQFEEPKDEEEVALIETEQGDILVKFCPEGAPKAVENFVTHAKEQYYDGTVFHRTIDGFMIQGGDPLGNGMGGESIWGKGFGVEKTDNLFHFRGALCMAQSAMPNSIGSQFYIVQAGEIPEPYLEMMRQGGFDNGVQGYKYSEAAAEKYAEVGGYPWLDQGYTVFGQVLKGMDVVDAIAAGAVLDDNGTAAAPVTVKQITVMTYQEAKEQGKA